MTMTATEFVVALRNALTRLRTEAGAFTQKHGQDPAAGSQAATERISYVRPESLYTVSSIGTLLIESVAEHVTLLIKAMTEPVEPLASWTCVRSMLESSAIAAWLFDPAIDAQKRVGQSYAYRYEGLEQQVKFARAMSFPASEIKKAEDLIDQLEKDALSLGFAAIKDKKGRRIGLAEDVPGATEIIRTMLDEEGAYRLLSAVAHGHAWAIHQLGFTRAQAQASTNPSGVHLVPLQKSSGTPAGYSYLVLRAAKSLGLPLWKQCLYFGWDKNQLSALLESVYDEMTATDKVRFWR